MYFYNTFQGPVEKQLRVLRLYSVFCNTLVTVYFATLKGYTVFTKAKGTVFKFSPKDTVYFTALFKAREVKMTPVVT